MQLPKVSTKWIVPILLLFITVSAIISVNLVQTQTSDIPDNRPDYLIHENQIPDSWRFDLEREIDGRYFLQIKTEETKAFSIETKEFVSNADAIDYLDASQKELISSGLELRFYEDQPKVTMSGVDQGFNWEVKSPCCFSRGVTYVIDTYFIYIFGSQESLWDDIVFLFTQQTASLLDYLGQDIPEDIASNITQESDATYPYLPVMSLFVISVLLRRKK